MITPDIDWYTFELQRIEDKIQQNKEQIKVFFATKKQERAILEADNRKLAAIAQWLRASKIALLWQKDDI